MKITLNRLDDAFHLEAINENGSKIETDGAPEIGGHNKGMRPMQLMLAAAGSCSTIDIISILKKQKQNLEDIQIVVTAEREKDKVPSLFTGIHLHYKLYGDITPAKAERAISLSVEKYCSVLKIMEQTANITSSYEVLKSN